KRRAGDLITGDSLGESGVVDVARVFEFALTRIYKAFVSMKLELESLDSGNFRIGHCVSRLAHDAHCRDLARGCSLLSGRFIYITNGQSIKQENSEWNALRTQETVLRWPISIPLHCRGRRLVHGHAAARSLELTKDFEIVLRLEHQTDLFALMFG